MSGALVIGLGQRSAGDDAVGLAVLDELAHRTAAGISLSTCADATALVELLGTHRRIVVVDAVVGAGPPGTVLSIPLEAVLAGRLAGISSHGLSLPGAISLASALYGTSPEIRIVGIAIDPPHALAPLSPPVRRAISEAARLALALAATPTRPASP